MIKISALNEESEDDSDSEEEVSKEALEQIALQQYSKALDLQRKGNLVDATQLLKDLLDTELLYDVKKPAPGEKTSGPLFNLKYLCYKNLGAILNVVGDVDAAIEAYTAASQLDETDVSLWHRFGLVCMQAKKYDMALYTFQRGVERNPRHWPCLDKIVTLLLGLADNEQCIVTIYEALKLDPGYLRGIVYRRHIYTVYTHMQDYMEHLSPVYKWKREEDEPIDEEKAEKLLNEAECINEAYIEQQKAEQFKHIVPNVKLKKPISSLTWKSVGDSLINMHNYMTEYCFSHACFVKISFELEDTKQEMDISEEHSKECDDTESKLEENGKAIEKEIATEMENNDVSEKDKQVMDSEKVECEVELVLTEPATESTQEVKTKRAPARRSGLCSLEQWGWCNTRRSGRKKTASRQDTIYDILRRMVPTTLAPEVVKKKENQANESLVDFTELFDENGKDESLQEYFGTENEQTDVKTFIAKYTENTKDIIDLLKDFLCILAGKWKVKWPEELAKIFIDANECYKNHIDIPACTDDNTQDLLHYTAVNLLVEEFLVNEILTSSSENKENHSLSVIESIDIILTLQPHLYSSIDCVEVILRHLWLKVHIHTLNKDEDLALDCLYQLLFEFDAMGDHNETYSLNIINFTFKPTINKSEILKNIKFLERNKELSTVNSLFKRGCYEEVLSIIIDSFEHFKTLAKNQEADMSLDFAVQLSLILDAYWALNKVDCCFKWSLTCLHEALKHYFRFTSGSADYEKWTLTVVKVLSCMEHILTTEGLSCLEAVSPKDLSQGLEDLIRIIGHQLETNSSDMPFDSVLPWIIMHYILQKEEDQGRGRYVTEKERIACDDVPNPLMLLFLAHEQLGNRRWCCKTDGKLLYFILDIVMPRLFSPSLSKSFEQVCQYMEQCIYCLYGHKRSKVKYILDHYVTPHELDWKRAQQIYEIFKPSILPALEGKLPGISADTEALFNRILSLLPTEFDPHKYLPEMDKYIKGIEPKLPSVLPLLPYKMKDIYFLLGDYYFKKEEFKQAIKFNTLDVIVNNDRFESWAQISLARASNIERALKSCKNLNSEREILNPAKSAIRCFKRSLQLDPMHCEIWIEYGNFVYNVHSFCSRLLKQASESLSMEDFEALEKQKENLLDTTNKCFTTVVDDLNNSTEMDKANEESWLFYYMLGKVAEKKNKPPSVYLNYFMQAVKSLQETDATYPLKINYGSPTHLCIEVLELHYRIHASILKYIEQHENKAIPASVGKEFMSCITQWQQGPFMKKTKKDYDTEAESQSKTEESQSVQAANILKRSVSDAGEGDNTEAKKMKLESAAAKVRRSNSYDTERTGVNKESLIQNTSQIADTDTKTDPVSDKDKAQDTINIKDVNEKDAIASKTVFTEEKLEKKTYQLVGGYPPTEKKCVVQESTKEDSSSATSTTSSSDSQSSESSSDSSSDSGRESDSSSKSSEESKHLTDEEIMKIVSACLDALEDCASRFPPHYKAIYRLAHYHFYYKKGKDIERCRDLMLSTFTSRSGQKLGGLFSERKYNNFFNNIWKIPHDEVERAGGFAFHMNRSVLLTMEVLKEIDDYKTLLDLSLHLQRVPEPDKTYLRDSDREDLAKQAFSLCIQSLKGQLLKFSQQADLKSNEVERQALKSLMFDIYKAYQRVQKQPNSKQFTNLLIDAYKLLITTPVTENMNLVDLSMKYCQSLKYALTQQATQVSLEKSQNVQKKQTAKTVENTKAATISTSQTKPESKAQTSTSAPVLPKITSHDMAAAFQNYSMSDPVLAQQTAAALSLSYLSNVSEYSSFQNTLQSSIQTLTNSFQAEFYRQFLGQNFSSYNIPPHKKQKRGPKPSSNRPPITTAGNTQLKPTKSFSGSIAPVSKSVPTSVITSIQKSTSAPLAPSMGTVLPTLPASLAKNLPSYYSHAHKSSHSVPQAHMTSASSVNANNHPKPPMPHQQVSPGKTLQEKLAERQKNNPKVSKTSQDINASISKLPSSLTITKTSSKQPTVQGKKPEAKKALSFESEVRPKPITSDEIIVLDDD